MPAMDYTLLQRNKHTFSTDKNGFKIGNNNVSLKKKVTGILNVSGLYTNRE